jgi:hypothetical protein
VTGSVTPEKTWVNETKIQANDKQQGDKFGDSVSISGDYAIVGAHIKNSYKGAAYIYKRDGTTWTEQANFTGEAASDEFGYSVSISGDYAIVGAAVNDTGTGAAYIYTRSGTSWTQQQELNGEATSFFGWSVSISGDYAIVGHRMMIRRSTMQAPRTYSNATERRGQNRINYLAKQPATSSVNPSV